MAEKNYGVLWMIVGFLSALVFAGGIIAIIGGLLKTAAISGEIDLTGIGGMIGGGLLMVFMGFTQLSKAIARL